MRYASKQDMAQLHLPAHVPPRDLIKVWSAGQPVLQDAMPGREESELQQVDHVVLREHSMPGSEPVEGRQILLQWVDDQHVLQCPGQLGDDAAHDQGVPVLGIKHLNSHGTQLACLKLQIHKIWLVYLQLQSSGSQLFVWSCRAVGFSCSSGSCATSSLHVSMTPEHHDISLCSPEGCDAAERGTQQQSVLGAVSRNVSCVT